MVDSKKLSRAIKIFPLFSGLTTDLIFWVAINTLFLTTVKHLSAAQINSIEAISTGVGIVFRFFLIKIVRKMGNLKAVRLGTIILFFSVTLNTFATTYIGLLIADLCYTIGLIFKHMDSAILIKNLRYLHKSDDYIKIQTQGSTIYSVITLVISLISGFLFNVSPYLPMIICMIICFINILLTYCLYEVPVNNSEKIKNNVKVHFDKSLILMILLYGIFFSMIAIGQKNSKLFIQLNMQDFLALDKVAIYMSIFLFISRISRLASNLIFLKVYNKLKNKIIFLLEALLVLAFVLLLIGNFIGRNMIGIYTMAVGFFIFLAIRDPFSNYMQKILFENSKEDVHDKIINYRNLSRKVFTLIYGLIISTMLVNLSYAYVMYLLLILSILFIIVIINIYNMLDKTMEEI